MLARLAVASIGWYQVHLSPHKGYRCAHRALHGGESCSAYAKRVIGERGLGAAAIQARDRFRECGAAARVLRMEREKRRTPSSNPGGDDAAVTALCCLLDSASSLADLAACFSCSGW